MKDVKKIKILTIHFGVNHGSVLQAYALSKYLSNNGFDAKIIDYIPKRYSLWTNLEKKKGQYPVFILIAYYLILCLRLYPKRYMFRHFCKKNLMLTNCIKGADGLKDISDDGDVFVAGSDQVWNEDYNGTDDFSYYFDFLPDCKKRVAYAASFGKSELFPEKYGKIVINYLRKFDAIGVREIDGVNKLAHYGIEAVHVTDPTMLLNKEEWRDFSKTSIYRRLRNKPYILVYVMDGIYEKLLDLAKMIKKRYGYMIIVLAFYRIADPSIDKMLHWADPKDFVALVDGAECVVTNSFHGTAFSIIFEKPSIICGKKNYNSRMLGTLCRLGLERNFVGFDKILSHEEMFELIENKERMQKAQLELMDWIGESKEFLLEALNNISSD
ncbi:MAG: polysaccharide pyruvyl transferase family protein [Clostridium sp.]|nr:polysaccharide pyruvyl transferase family protein [Clostridium sp.]